MLDGAGSVGRGEGELRFSGVMDWTSFTLYVRGALDVETVGAFREIVDGLLDHGYRYLALDIGGLRMIDSPGVGAIIYVYRRLRSIGGTMVMSGANEQPLAVLRLMRLDRLLMAGDEAGAGLAAP